MNLRLEAQTRTPGRKSVARTQRRQGKIPGILYGVGEKNIPILIEQKEFTRALRQSIGRVSFFEVVVEGQSHVVVIKEKQIQPVTRDVMHVDFMELHPDKEINVDIPLLIKGEPIGMKDGGVMELLVHKIPVSCLPKDIQGEITIDVTNLGLGQALHLRDLNIGAMTTKLSPDLAIVNVQLPKAQKESKPEAAAPEAAAAAAPAPDKNEGK